MSSTNVAVPTSPTTVPPLVIHINLTPTLGVDFIGVVFASILYGITVLQMIYYYQTYTKDRLWVKLLVAALWALDSTSLALVVHGVYTYLVTDFANFEAASSIVWSIASEPAVTSVVALTVDCFLIYRILTLRKNWWPIGVFLFIWALAPFSIGIVAVWRTNTGAQSLSAVSELHWMAIAAGSLTSSLDLTISMLLCYLLWQGRTVFKSTNQIIQTIALYVIMSGLTTAVLQWLTLITYLAAPSTLAFQLFTMIGSKAYVNTLMATLNSRQSIRGLPAQSSLAITTNSVSTGSQMLPVFRAAPRPADSTTQAAGEEFDEYPLQFKVSGDGGARTPYTDTIGSASEHMKTKAQLGSV